MQPLSHNTKPSIGKCLDPVSSKCVIWDGPDITCLDGTKLCKGQSIEGTVAQLAEKLCEIQDALRLDDISRCLNPSLAADNAGQITAESSIKEVFDHIINRICVLNTNVETLASTEATVEYISVPSCLLAGYANAASVPATLPLKEFSELVATIVCSLLIKITELQSESDSITTQIQALWDTLTTCTTTVPQVLPSCTYNWSEGDGSPVNISVAYTWLEAAFCELKSAVGSPDQITNAVEKACPGLNDSPKLSTGGVMSDIPGWSTSATPTLAQSLGNLWLTVCDMRAAVANILDTCCFSTCRFLSFQYTLYFDPAGTYVDVIFNAPGHAITFYDPNPVTAHSPEVASPGGTPPAWVSTAYPVGSQTNVIITISDGATSPTTLTVNTGDTLFGIAYLSNVTNNGIRLTFPGGYDTTSTNQTIQFTFDYAVFTGTSTETCNFDLTDALVYQCNTPVPFLYDTVTEVTATSVTVTINSFVEETGELVTGTSTGGGADTLLDNTGGSWASGDFALNCPSQFPNALYLLTGSTVYDGRYITSSIGTSAPPPPLYELTVNSNWDTPVGAGVDYKVKDIVYPINDITTTGCVYTSLTNPLNYLQSVTFYTVTNNSTYDPNDFGTWDIINQKTIPSEPPFDPANFTSIVYESGDVLTPNTDYIVNIIANYSCGSSEYVSINILTDVLGIIRIQVGKPGSSVGSAFSDAKISVTDIQSNTVALANQTAMIGNPATISLELPTSNGDTGFAIQPIPPIWANGQFCRCGLLADPDGPNSGRDIIGLYRGFESSIWKFNSVGSTYTKIIDLSSNQYVTDSFTDSTLYFNTNNPTITTTSPLPFDTTLQNQGIVTNYPSSTYDIVVRHDPAEYPVNISQDYHTINVKFAFYYAAGCGCWVCPTGQTGATGSNPYWGPANYPLVPLDTNGTTKRCSNGDCGTVLYNDFYFEVEVRRYDNSSSSYVPYNPARILKYTPADMGAPFSVPANPLIPNADPMFALPHTETNWLTPVTLSAAYGDALYVKLFTGTTNSTTSDKHASVGDIRITPTSASDYSCWIDKTANSFYEVDNNNLIMKVTEIGQNQDGQNQNNDFYFGQQGSGVTGKFYLSGNVVITEDYNVLIVGSLY